jgi:vitamin B12 transporter
MTSFAMIRCRRASALSLAAFVPVALYATGAAAQPAQSAATSFGVMAPIVVTPTLFPTPAAEVGSDVTVITAQDIARQQERTLADVLKDVPGLFVEQTSPGQVATVFMRGTNSNHVKVIVDGIDVSDPTTPAGAFDFSQILASDIERVEVLRGPQSGIYGSDAIGGVVNIITKRGSSPAKATGMVEGGSFGTFDQAAGVSGSQGRANYAFNFEHLHYSDLTTTPSNLLAAGEAAIPDAFGARNYSARLGADLTDDFSVGAVALYTESLLRNTSDDNFLSNTPDPTQSLQDERAGFARATAKLKSLDDQLENEWGIAYTRYHRVNITPTLTPTTNDGDRTKFDWHGTLKLGDGRTAVVGFDDEEDRLLGEPISANMNDAGGFAELQTPIVNRLYANGTVRVDGNNRFGHAVTWRVAPAYLVAPTDTQLRASYGTGFKAPTLEQLFENFPGYGFFSNPHLRPEKSSGYDMGFDQPLLNQRVRFGATYFHNHIRDLIQSTSTTYINVSSATMYGVESFVAVQPLQQLTLRANYTYTQAASDTAVSKTTGDVLLRRPKHKISVDATWTPTERTSLTTTWLYIGARFDDNRDASNTQPLHVNSYNTVNLDASYKLTGWATVFGRIDNLLDRRYQDPTGFLGPSLGIFAGVRLTWGGAPGA